ncbi:MAG: SEL1-like repeat protein [Deltaproteobacteria bacterium]|jgi:TPR repeat protein|nr:SEL1-like repeat protein [Deltaproteobacteria bacterium]
MAQKPFAFFMALAFFSMVTSMGLAQTSSQALGPAVLSGLNQETLNKANQGDPEAQLEIGLAHYLGQGVPVNYGEGVSWIFRAAVNGSDAAQYRLGLAIEEGLGVPQSDRWAFHWFELASLSGYAPAVNKVGLAYLSGRGTDKDEPKALEFFFEAAKKELPEAYLYLGNAYEGGLGTERDPEIAYAFYKQAAQLDPDIARIAMASLPEPGEPEDYSHEKMIGLAKRASAKDVYDHAMGYYVYHGFGDGILEPYVIELLGIAAEKGHPEAMYRLAEYYLFGNQLNFHWEDRIFTNHAKLDWGKAFDLFRRAYGAGCLKAAMRLAQSYGNGWGVPPDPAQELSWINKAIEHGLNGANTALGIKYLYGDGVPKDERKALALFKLDAKVMAAGGTAFFLSYAYDIGLGVPVSREQAYKIRLTADNFPGKSAYEKIFSLSPLRPMLASNLEISDSLRRNAERGVAGAQFSLGSIYWLGQGVPEDRGLAAEWWAKAAEQGLFMAQFNMGLLRFAPDLDGPVPLDEDATEAFRWFLMAAEQGEVNSQKFVAWAYYAGEGVRPDPAKGFYWYLKASEQGDTEATYNLGWAFQNGLGVAADPAQAFPWYEKAAASDYARSEYAIGMAYYYGLGVTKNLKKGFEWFERAGDSEFRAMCERALAFDQGLGAKVSPQSASNVMNMVWKSQSFHPNLRERRLALNFLVSIYQNNRTINFPTYEYDMRKILEAAAFTAGSVEARYVLAREYDLGLHGPEDKAIATALYRLAAQGGHAKAQERMGWAYDQGYGVEIDEGEALGWFLKASAQGLAMSQYKVGMALLKGYGVKADPKKGFGWVEFAAKRGLPIAQHEVGLAYQRGEFVPKDEAKAAEWFGLAKQNGFTQIQYNMGVNYLDLKVTFDNLDFNYDLEVADNWQYKSTAVIEARFFREGQETITNQPVTWRAEIVQNPREPWWLRGPKDLNGLYWGIKLHDFARWADFVMVHLFQDGVGYWGKNEVIADPPTGRMAYLNDVVGQRTVKLTAVTNIDGINYQDSAELTFGKGPLSDIGGAPFDIAQYVTATRQWEQLNEDTINFPTIAGICHGSVGAMESYHSPNDKIKVIYLKNSNLPDTTVLKKLQVARLETPGGALAAGWPTGKYLTGRVVWDSGIKKMRYEEAIIGGRVDDAIRYSVCAAQTGK